MRLLIVEDEALVAHDLRVTVESFGHTVVGVAASGAAAIALAAQVWPDLALMDIRLHGPLDGIATARQIRELYNIPSIYLTAYTDSDTVRRAASTDPYGYLPKPFDERTLWVALEMAAHRHQIDRRLQASEDRFATILHSIGDAVIVTDTLGTITFANGVATRLIGLAPSDLIGRPIGDALVLIDAQTRQPLPSIVAQVLEQQAPVYLTVPALLLAHDGHEWPIDDSAAPIWDTNEQVAGVVIVFREVSARQAAEAARQAAEAALRDTNAQLAASIAELERRTAELTVFSELGGAFMRCTALEEGYAIIARAARRLFPNAAGALYVHRRDQPMIEPVIVWGVGAHHYPQLHIHDCCALREERIFLADDAASDCHCKTYCTEATRSALCVPLIVEEETLGVLHVQLPADAPTAGPARAARWQLTLAFAEQVALGLANVRLRTALREQAIRDPLTGLFNRRYLEETLAHELHRAIRGHYPVGVIMLDIDHFKQINDTYGHEAGDIVLRMLSKPLLGAVRAGDVVCRYGGEEFVLMLPSAPLAVVTERAEAIRHAVSDLEIEYNQQPLPPITVSLGATIVTDEHESFADALARADAALYQAKRSGRNRVVSLERGVSNVS